MVNNEMLFVLSKKTPADSEYCVCCGASLQPDVDEKENKQVGASRNLWASLGLMLFLITLIVFDGFATFLFTSRTIIFIISIICYTGVLLCSMLALRFELKKKKKSETAQSNYSLIIAQIMMSILMILINLQQLTVEGGGG